MTLGLHVERGLFVCEHDMSRKKVKERVRRKFIGGLLLRQRKLVNFKYAATIHCPRYIYGPWIGVFSLTAEIQGYVGAINPLVTSVLLKGR